MGGTARSLSQSGWPENSSASKPMVPASSASCSVADTLGRMPLILRKSGLDQRRAPHRWHTEKPARTTHRHPGKSTQEAEAQARSPVAVQHALTARRRPQPPAPAAQAQSGARRMAKHEDASHADGKENTTHAGMAAISLTAPNRRPSHQRNSMSLTVFKVDVYVNFKGPDLPDRGS